MAMPHVPLGNAKTDAEAVRWWRRLVGILLGRGGPGGRGHGQIFLVGDDQGRPTPITSAAGANKQSKRQQKRNEADSTS
jgi:hypothetical protein